MYGSLHDDPIIKYYDISFALGSPDEIPWYIRKATQCGSPVLDLACGTGRLALEFARNGMQVVALDSSEGMIEIFKEKLSREPAAIRNRIYIERQSMNNFNLTKNFRTVVCCDAFFHNLTPDDERECLKAINRHLRPAGYFLFNIHYNPNPEFLSWASSAEAAKFHKRAEYLIPNTRNTLYIEESLSHDAFNQLIDTKLRFEVKDEKGNIIDQSASGWQSRYLCKYEAIYLLELCGFSVESIVGDYRDQPVSIKSQLIFTARKQKDIGCIRGGANNSSGCRYEVDPQQNNDSLPQKEKMSISQEVSIIGQAFVNGLKRILGEKLHGTYIYGAAAFPDTVPTGDIDYHVILKSGLTDSERSELEMFHEYLAEKYPPLGGEMDGYYILLSDACRESPPRSQMWRRAADDSWALHREHIRAGRHIVLHGPEPREIYPPASWPEIESALYGELDYVEKHLHEYPDYCILNLCRLIYSFETKDVVVSKAQTSNWACDALPEWKRHIELARKSYARQATAEERQFMLAEVGALLEFARVRIERACQRWR